MTYCWPSSAWSRGANHVCRGPALLAESQHRSTFAGNRFYPQAVEEWKDSYVPSFLRFLSHSVSIFLARASRSLSGLAANNLSATSRSPFTTMLTVRR